ncbi:MAG TPA: DeoR/GlpR transcriptional regulator [Lachnoclostridium sp.]|jgi:DeoR family fructose operon transcriptional repressor|uniref:DeoR/GlpR family DNA-binding transcription regulator n=1 Tax=Lacrimispora sp. TaxID=2719234 RepID=UPI000EB9F090|nr:DeoR/GlpR family DNA-binding transcription regulator [Lacrimispora sp.]HCD43417.1 DeoR/GlpR transcriptional regulator [Lachnoclostridium sp.]
MNEKETVFMEERKQMILNLLQETEKVTVAYLSELFNVSGATIRSDLRDLENEKLLLRTHGGAMRISKSAFEIEPQKRGESTECKEAIAREAVKFIDDGDTIAVDTGSTCYMFAKLLGTKKDLRVVTNDLSIAALLDQFEDITVYFIGGVIRKHYNCTIGSFGSAPFQDLVVDKAIMGTNSFTLAKGATTPDVGQAEMKRLLVSISDKVFILGNSDKIGRNSFVTFAESNHIDVIITDGAISKAYKESIEDSGIELVIAE